MKSSSDLLFTKKHFGLLAIVREGTPAKSLEFEPNSWQLIFPHSHFQNVPHIWDGEANDLQRSFLIIFLSFWTVTLPKCFPIFPKIFCTTKCRLVPWEIMNISCQCFLKNMFFSCFIENKLIKVLSQSTMSQEYMLWNKFTVGESVSFYSFSIHIHKTLICQDLYQVWVCSVGDCAAACFSRKWHILVAIFFLLTFNKTFTSKTCTVDLLESYLIFLFIELASIGNEKQSQNHFLLPFPTNICA